MIWMEARPNLAEATITLYIGEHPQATLSLAASRELRNQLNASISKIVKSEEEKE